jgi:hypothetical protein
MTNDLTVAELLAAFFPHAKAYYRGANDEPTSEVNAYVAAMRPLKALYARTAVRDFGPLAGVVRRSRQREGGRNCGKGWIDMRLLISHYAHLTS